MYRDVNVDLNSIFIKGDPFPYIVFDNFLNDDDAEKLLIEHALASNDKKCGSYIQFNERKSGIKKYDQMGTQTQKVIDTLSSKEFMIWLEKLTSIKKLIPDPSLDIQNH